MIKLINRDDYIFDLDYRIVDIIKEYQDLGNVLITTNAEGICLESCGFYKILDYTCEKFNFNKQNIILTTSNAEETHKNYKVKNIGSYWINECKKYIHTVNTKKVSKPQHIGSFNNKPHWDRLLISSWLDKNYSDRCLLSFCYDPKDEQYRSQCQLTKINIEAREELHDVVSFLEKCPMILEDKGNDYTIGGKYHYNILKRYSEIFVDVVCETYISGKSFFPTEKTLRPIIANTPFITMAPAGYLDNLKRIGFKTFDQWWSEEYDSYSGYQRILQIRSILADIVMWDNNKIQQTLGEMEEILSYNLQVLQNLQIKDINLTYD